MTVPVWGPRHHRRRAVTPPPAAEHDLLMHFNSSPGLLVDSIGNFTPTATGPYEATSSAVFGGGIRWNGYGYLSVPLDARLDASDGAEIECWCYITGGGGGGVPPVTGVVFTDSGGTRRFGFYTSPSSLSVGGYGASFVSADGVLTANAYNHIVFKYFKISGVLRANYAVNGVWRLGASPISATVAAVSGATSCQFCGDSNATAGLYRHRYDELSWRFGAKANKYTSGVNFTPPSAPYTP